MIKENRLLEPLGRRAGSFAKDPVVSFVLHVHTEFVHHTAEIALFRDLYRGLWARQRCSSPACGSLTRSRCGP